VADELVQSQYCDGQKGFHRLVIVVLEVCMPLHLCAFMPLCLYAFMHAVTPYHASQSCNSPQRTYHPPSNHLLWLTLSILTSRHDLRKPNPQILTSSKCRLHVQFSQKANGSELSRQRPTLHKFHKELSRHNSPILPRLDLPRCFEHDKTMLILWGDSEFYCNP